MNFVTERCVRILYAGETGNAEEVAYDIQSQLPYQAVVSSLEEYDVLELPAESAVIFVVSTTGDGDTPGAMKTFWSFLLKKSLSNVALQQIMYGVFGLGDSSYEKYNAVARKLDRRLQMLGGKELVALGLGDDQAEFGYLSALNYWLSILIKNLAECGCTPPLPLKSSITTHVYKVSNVNIINITTSAGTISGHNGAQSKVYTTTVACNERLTASVWGQDVRHIRLHFPVQRDVSLYEVGDVAVVHYLNLPELVARATALISEGSLRHDGVQLSADTLLDIKHISQSSQSKRPSRIGSIDNVTLHSLLQRHLDIGAVPKRSYFAALAQYATNPEEADKLRELASPEGTDLYFDYCIRERMCYIEVLEEFRSCRPPLSALLELIQIIPPRQYSIASSPAMLPNEVNFDLILCWIHLHVIIIILHYTY